MPRRIVVGITGGIAAYKVPALIRLLRKQGNEIRVVLTQSAKGLVGEEALRTVSEHPVFTDSHAVYDMDHIRLAEWGQWLLICPATANTIAKIAHGIADNLLSTLALSIPSNHIIIVPAMNSEMWSNAATVENVATLAARGVRVLPVDKGDLACGTSGLGRMIGIEEIAGYIGGIDMPEGLLKGRKILIASGPTREPIDPVRVITNRSSGRMGAELARCARDMGAEVTVVSGPSAVPLPAGVTVEKIVTALEMREAMLRRFEQADICIMAAAVSDFRPSVFSESKIDRQAAGSVSIELISNPDILAELGSFKKTRFLTGFALETSDDEPRAREKMKRKNCDLMVFNQVSKSLESESTSIALLYRDGKVERCLPCSKAEAARLILSRIAEMAGQNH